METFETYVNNQKINVKVTHKSLASQYGTIVFYLINKNDDTDSEALDEDQGTTKINKEDAVQRSILYINTQFAVTQGQMPNKNTILKGTLVKYVLSDRDSKQTYLSTYVKFPNEYKDGGSNVFSVTKRIEIVFKEDILTDHKEFVKELEDTAS